MDGSRCGLLLVAGALAVGCAPAAVTTTDEAPIRGGVLDAEDRAVVFVEMEGGHSCSGSLVAKNVVLTATHCVNGARPTAVWVGPGPFNAEGRAGAPTGSRHAIRELLQFPGVTIGNDGVVVDGSFDAALLRLDDDVADIPPLTLALDRPKVDEECRAVGFGLHDGETHETAAHAKRSASVLVTGFSQSGIDTLRMTGSADRGDSGGPLLCGERIAGVAWRLLPAASGGWRTDALRYVRVEGPVAEWVETTIGRWEDATR